MLKKTGLAILTSLFLWLCWPEGGVTPFLFIALVPLLFLEDLLNTPGIKRKGGQLFLYSFISFGLWNLLTLLWLFNAHWSGVVAAIVINGSGMGLVVVLYHRTKRKLGNQRGLISLPFLWISFETLHKYWDLGFPWLTLGNGFAERVSWIQWYEWTGVFGGSLWVWVVNIFCFLALKGFLKHRQIKPLIGQSVTLIVLLIVAPILISVYRYHHYQEKGDEANVVVVQPNFNTYTEKFSLSEDVQLAKFIELAQQRLNDSVDFLIGPETMLASGFDESGPLKSNSVRILKQLTEGYPNLNIFVGANTLKYYHSEPYPITSQPSTTKDAYLDFFNTGVFINKTDSIGIYHKSKLVAGVEMMPFIRVLKPLLGHLVKDMGGTSASLGTQKERENFTSANGKFTIAPNICWESDFGEYTAQHVNNGANLIFIITNDDWWENTQGHRQHKHYARLRAIENRRSIARSANTGTSCFINQRGDIIQPQTYRTDAVIQQKIKANKEITFYSRFGDVLSRLSLFMSGFFVLYTMVGGYLGKQQLKK